MENMDKIKQVHPQIVQLNPIECNLVFGEGVWPERGGAHSIYECQVLIPPMNYSELSRNSAKKNKQQWPLQGGVA